MNDFPWRTILAFGAAVALSLILFIFVSHSPYIFALSLVLGAYLARITTFKAGLLFGALASLPFAVYLVWIGFMPADSDEATVVFNALLVVLFGGLYCGAVTWLIQRLKQGQVFFS